MYSEELEELIGAVLADGEITDKEREVLHKKAAEEGVDPDELDVVIDGRLAKMRPTPPIQPAQSNKMGNVMKCPSCGAPYEPGTGKCSNCGHVFQNINAVKSSVKLAEGIQKILAKGESGFFRDKSGEDVCNYIENFPIPNAKDDILDFLISLDAKRKAGMLQQSGYESAYAIKYKEVIKKAKILFPGDPQIEQAIAMTDKKYLSATQKALIYLLIMMLICSLPIFFL